MKTTEMNYSVIFQREPEGGYTVIVPTLPGCITYGKDLDEARKMAREAIELYLESLKEHKEEIPYQEQVLYGQVRVTSSL